MNPWRDANFTLARTRGREIGRIDMRDELRGKGVWKEKKDIRRQGS